MKRALLILVFCLGCKTHKNIQKTETVKIDSVKTNLSVEKVQSITDSNVAYLKSSNVDYTKRTTITEYDTEKTVPVTDVILNGFWSLPEKTDKGKTYTDVTDTTRKAIYDSTTKVVTIYKNGKVQNRIKGAAQTGLANPIKKQTIIDEHYQSKDSSLYYAQLRKKDSIDRLNFIKDSLAIESQKKQSLDQGSSVSVFTSFWFWIGISVALIILYMTIFKKWQPLIDSIKTKLK